MSREDQAGAEAARPRIVVMGVAGAGKTTVGVRLATELQVPFVDADDLHSPENIDKMSAGVPLTDEDRQPWLRAVGTELRRHPTGAVVACSALTRAYRDVIRQESPDARFVLLTADQATLVARMSSRADHYMPVSLLDSQLRLLQPLAPDEPGIALEATAPIEEIITGALREARVEPTSSEGVRLDG